jgi:hypothetical protein
MRQLPFVVVCDVALDDDDDDDEDDDDEAGVVVVAVLAPVRFVVAAAVWLAVALWPSCQANTPPSDSVAATLSAAAARRARAARGLRRGRRVAARDVRSGVGSAMATTVRTAHEGLPRAG